MKFSFVLVMLSVLLSCKENNYCKKITVDKSLLDSVKKKADTSYTKSYRSKEFANAEYYINRKDTTVCQIMKDTADQVRQIIMSKRDTKLFNAEYYGNGQLKAHLPLDENGRLNGKGEFYFENGCVKSKGIFYHGFYVGEWKIYNDKGLNISIDKYDSNGQLIKTVPTN